MRNKKIIYTLIILVSFAMLPKGVIVNATTTKNNIDLVILLNENSGIDRNIEDIITNSGGKIVKRLPDIGGIEVNCSSDLIPIIKLESCVQSLAPNQIITLANEKNQKFNEDVTDFKVSDDNLNNRYSGDLYEKYQWDIKRVTNDGKSFAIESGNHDVVVGIIDSGVDKTHPDLINNFLGGKNLVPANFKGDSSETGDLNDITDRWGHGTQVAGIIAANGRTKGVAPNIGFKSYRVFNKNGETNETICASAIINATNDGVKVINLSIGGYDLKGKLYWTDSSTGIKYYLGDDTAKYSLIERAIKYAINNGVTVITAAGNDGQDCSNPQKLTDYLNSKYNHYGFIYNGLTYQEPGTINDVITVSATGRSDNLTPYSNYGKNFIDISAPGGDIKENINIEDTCLTTNINSGYAWIEGTSFSAPKVSAVAALIACKNKDISSNEIAEILYKTADELNCTNSSEYYGAGIVDAYNALNN